MQGTPIELITHLYNQDKEKQFELKEYKEKRSITSNSYLWQIINKIGNAVTKSKEEVYFEMLKDYGQSALVSIQSTIQPEGYFKYYEAIGTGIIGEKEFTHYKIFKGSSEYNSQEMHILLEGVKQEAEQLGIETKTETEIQNLLSLMEE